MAPPGLSDSVRRILPLVLGASPIAAAGQDFGDVRVPRVEAEIVVDGVLDEAVWRQAALLDGFSQYLPVDGRPAADPTEVLVWYSPTAIHFGIRSHEAHADVRATLADRDKIEGGDYVQLLLDTFNDRREAFLFAVNPLGVQADGIVRDRSRRAGSGFSAEGGGAYSIDLSPDFVFDSKGSVSESGYVVEVRVPFKSLRYQSGNVQDWGFNVIRKVQHSGYENTWTPVLQAHSSFLAQGGVIRGLTDLRRGVTLDLNPVMTARIDGSPTDDGWEYRDSRPQAGGNVKWGVTNNVTLTGTVNPDFSQVEADVAQVQYDPRESLFYPEKRPFFLEGIEYFSMPAQLIYSRRLVDPVAAAKVTGKVSGTTVALLSGVDDESTSATGTDNPVYNLLRVRRNLGGESTLGMAYTDKVDGSHFNRVVSADGRLVFGGGYSATFQVAESFTHDAGNTVAAPFWSLSANRSGQRYGFRYSFQGVHPDFRAEGGFIRRSDWVSMLFSPSITTYGEEGAFLERWTGSIAASGEWDYDTFTDWHVANDLKLHFNSAFELRGGWRVSTSFLVESFKFPPKLYTGYRIERTTGAGTDTIPFTGTHRLQNFDLVVSVATPRYQTFWGNVTTIVGRDENFFEWAPANVVFVNGTVNWRPTQQVRVTGLYNHQQYLRPSDGSSVAIRRVPGLRFEYQLSRSVFVRFVGQYDSNVRDALRDESRTGHPILIEDPATGEFVRALRQERNDLRVDWLFSYRPTPGTVVFLGYGSSLDDPTSFRFRDTRRVSDGFFAKVSYLFRL